MINIPEIINPLTQEDFQLLQATLTHVGLSDCYGVDEYIQVLEFIYNHNQH